MNIGFLDILCDLLTGPIAYLRLSLALLVKQLGEGIERKNDERRIAEDILRGLMKDSLTVNECPLLAESCPSLDQLAWR